MKISRRNAMIGVGGVGLLAAVPVTQKLSWDGRNFERDDYQPGMHQAPEGRTSWRNWSGNQRANPRNIFSGSSDEELADFLRATSDRVRPVGSGHSFSALTPTDGVIVETNSINAFVGYDDTTGLATFGSGARLFEVSSDLDAIGRAWENLSDIDVQTMAGAFATATHGTGADLTAMHDCVEGFRMVAANGSILDVTRESNSDLFYAGLVGLGALGIITRYTIRTVPQYKLKRETHVLEIEEILDRIDEFSSDNRHFEFFYFPGTGIGAVILQNVTEESITEESPEDDEEALEALKMLRDKLGWAPWLRRRAAKSNMTMGLVEERVDISSYMLAATRSTQFNEMEYHLPREEGVSTVRRVIKMLDRRKDSYFPLEYRHVASDAAWLSPFKDGARASIAIHAGGAERFDYFFSDFEPMYLDRGGRPHWGKLHSLRRQQLGELYPEFERFSALRKDIDPTGKFLNEHLAELFEE